MESSDSRATIQLMEGLDTEDSYWR